MFLHVLINNLLWFNAGEKRVKKQRMIVLLVTAILMVSMLSPAAYAAKDENSGKKEGHTYERHIEAKNSHNNGKGPVQHLYLYERDPTSGDIVPDGSWGKVTILTHKDKFVFNGHKLQKTTAYSLACFEQGMEWPPGEAPWNMEGSLIGSSEKGKGPNIHIMGEWEDTIHKEIMLVISTDYDPIVRQMTGWNPEGYLFGYDPLPEQTETTTESEELETEENETEEIEPEDLEEEEFEELELEEPEVDPEDEEQEDQESEETEN